MVHLILVSCAWIVGANAQVVWDFNGGSLTPSYLGDHLSATLTIHNLNTSSYVINDTSEYTSGESAGNNLGMSAVAGELDLATSTYLELTVTPDAGYGLLFKDSSLMVASYSTATGPARMWAYFVDGGVARYNLTSGGSGILNTTSIWANQRIMGTGLTIIMPEQISLVLRLYASGGTGEDAINWRIDDLNFGIVAVEAAGAVPEVANAGLLVGFTIAGLTVFRRRQRAA